MNGLKRTLAVALLAVFAAAGWADPSRLITVPISGEYWEPAAGGMLVYSGTVTFEWLAAGSEAAGWPVTATLVGQAWCKNTGAGYALYGLATDSLKGTKGATAELWESILAIGGDGRPAFGRDIRVAVSLGDATVPPTVFDVATGRALGRTAQGAAYGSSGRQFQPR